MSWLFSRALVEASSAGSCSAGEPSALSSGSPMPQAYLSPDKMTAFSRLSRFGMTFAPLTDDRGQAVLTWFLAGFPVRTSASQGRAQASPESAPACGPTWRASLAKFDPASSSWRTAQLSLLGDSELSSVTWPRSGMTAGGQCWELPMSERLTGETDSGLWVPTPNATDGSGGGARMENLSPGHQKKLRDFAKTWPTPHGFSPDGRSNGPSGNDLGRAVNQSLKVATSTARDWRSGKASQATHDKNSRHLSEQIGGSLNPTWVEWLMGWPLGWTDLKPLATGKSRSAPQPRGEFSLAESVTA